MLIVDGKRRGRAHLLCSPQDFARARDVLVENSLMAKRALSAVAGFLTLCLPLFAQQSDPPAVFSALNSPALRLPSLTLSDGGSFSFAGTVAPSLLFNWMELTSDFLPALSMASTTAISRRAPGAVALADDSSKEILDARRPYFDYTGGEVGAVYGRSSGKYGREIEGGYIFGEVGNDKLQISAGVSYERSSGRFPQFSR